MKNKIKKTEKPTLLSMFSGCGGLDLGFKQAGFDIVWANDNDKDACETYSQKKNKLGDILCGDIGDCEIPDIKNLDVLSGGFPCQAFSNAGNRRGVHDHRGELYKYCLEYIEALKPKATVFENVRGLLTIKGRNGLLIEEIADDLGALGYTVYINLVKASNYGVPQNRMRSLVVGIRNDLPNTAYAFPKAVTNKNLSIGKAILGISDSALNQQDLLRLNPQAVELGKHVPPGGSWKSIPDEHLPPRLLRIRADMRKYRWPNFYRRFHKDEVAGTITAAFKPENAGVWHPVENRVMSVREIASIQTFPKTFVFKARSVKAMYQMIGNAVPPLLAKKVALSLIETLDGVQRTVEMPTYQEIRSSGAPIRPSIVGMKYN